ncbi:MAG: hypothetical protein LQ352_004781 [Teloschistes flavicans]|nr:MAG: hypothetical protein LQ352_004781 [Teloschistes flavicans]
MADTPTSTPHYPRPLPWQRYLDEHPDIQPSNQIILSSPNPQVRNQEKIRLLRKQITARELTSKPFVLPTPKTTDPLKPIQVEQQLFMHDLVKYRGHYGLMHEIYRIAEDEK